MPIGDNILSLCHLEACERQRLALLDLLELSDLTAQLIEKPWELVRCASSGIQRRKRIYQAMMERAQHR